MISLNSRDLADIKKTARAGGAVGQNCGVEREGSCGSSSSGGGYRKSLLEVKSDKNLNQQQQQQGGIMDSHQQQFCLKWNSFGSNLATSFSNLFKSESLTDVTLFCEGVTFKAHRLILAACSKHFQELFEGMPPSPAGLIVILDGTNAHNMAALLEFMYRGEVHVSQESLSSFLKAAECLQVKGLSIEHEKLAVAQSQVVENNNNNGSNTSSSSNKSNTSTTSSNISSNVGSINSSKLLNNNNSNNNNLNESQVDSSSILNNTCTSPISSGISTIPATTTTSSSNITTTNNHYHLNKNGLLNDDDEGRSLSAISQNERNVSSGGCPNSSVNNVAELAAEAPENGLARGIKRRTPTPAPLSPAPTYSLPNVYSAQHYYESPQKRIMSRSPSEIDSISRASVLRDGAAFRPASAPHPMLLDNHLYQTFNHPLETPTHPHTAPHTPTELERELERERSQERANNIENKESVAEDLRIKQEPVSFTDRDRLDKLTERLTSTSNNDIYNGRYDTNYTNNTTEHLLTSSSTSQQLNNSISTTIAATLAATTTNQILSNLQSSTQELNQIPPTPATWNSKINKAGTVTTPDGKKLKCPFCERLYGYETNLRAHIRQRHQGIRVPCPYCTRTFTRNNTVRRHIAREHKPELSLKSLPVADTVQQ